MFTYKVKKYTTRLFVDYQAIISENKQINAEQLMASIRLITEAMGKIVNTLEGSMDCSRLIVALRKEDAKPEDLEHLINTALIHKCLAAKMRQKKELKESALLGKFGMLKQTVDLEEKGVLLKAVKSLRSILQQDIDYFDQEIGPALPIPAIERSETLAQLMPKIKNILGGHIVEISTEIASANLDFMSFSNSSRKAAKQVPILSSKRPKFV